MFLPVRKKNLKIYIATFTSIGVLVRKKLIHFNCSPLTSVNTNLQLNYFKVCMYVFRIYFWIFSHLPSKHLMLIRSDITLTLVNVYKTKMMASHQQFPMTSARRQRLTMQNFRHLIIISILYFRMHIYKRSILCIFFQCTNTYKKSLIFCIYYN